ncbi:hypothetical protein PRIPAC_83116 [Pristionchus pacificus]|uniref:Uncharacterized protein n=1 Tax=Pristionchus pacificus TaxID=54126 RepID=A0A2A6BUQ8_PRIPA|nr:hypothetical protein PRIPAC_83116 [Pristionchus pacificus]|eukprot:PDM69712.1 hypothetical protein PRIPAC_44808 [Pristionchus pacificus]
MSQPPVFNFFFGGGAPAPAPPSGFRQSQPLVVAQDEIVRLLEPTGHSSHLLDVRLRGGIPLPIASSPKPVKLELAFVESEKDCAYNFV